MTEQSMRGLMISLEAGGELHPVSRAVDPKFELGVVLSLRDRGPAGLFQTTGTLPVIGNLLASRRRFAQGLGIEPGELDARCLAALKHPIKPVMIASGVAQDVVRVGPFDLAELLPVPTWFERETGPYITAGVISAKDPETGHPNR